MPDTLIQHMRKYIPLDGIDSSHIIEFFKEMSVRKKETLLSENELCRWNYFVVKGCLRMFFVNEKGVEQTVHFAIENWWVTDYLAYSNQKTSSFSIQAVEASEVLAMSLDAQEQLLRKFPVIERYFRLVFQRAYSAAQMRIRYLYSFSREEFYNHFSKHFPEFIQRVPQYLLASYLNMTPEYLSELRSKKRS